MNQHDPEFQFVQGQFCWAFLNDAQEAKKRLTYAARKGHAEAQYLLGQIYEQEQAYHAAAKWLRLAAWQGQLATAQYSLSQFYLRGLGVKPDATVALRWLRAAAEGGNTIAMCELGVTLQDRDVVEAYAWLTLARARRSAAAAEAARSLRPSLLPAQVAEAKMFAAKLRAQLRKPMKQNHRPHRGLRYQVGTQEVWGSMCEWNVEYSVQSWSDGRWTLYVEGEEGGTVRDGPMYPEFLPETLEERGLEVSEFLAQLRARDVPVLSVLARQIEDALAENGECETAER